MQYVYLCAIYAGHDFNSLVHRRVFADNIAATSWGESEAAKAKAANDERDPRNADIHNFFSEVSAIPFQS